MGKGKRLRPERLADKLLQIRLALGLSQNELLDRLGLKDQMLRTRISEFELGSHEPPLPVLLRYARIANVWIDVLVDDELDLPPKLPSSQKHEGVRRRTDNPVRTSKRQPAQ
jgi:transcriptional regulator with XRE-family HTH domain